ncbi:Ig-like domain-containing protein [Microvirga sp. ACRRW]|uniref:VCBS domain-containing protein n=1 Tax=Microvirga sp. ACRRW TaxID=2918205 RepID=UPI001EF5AF2B|nr:VCBS domain-containing protein [Microvirga sp. ACRRW]MCG7393429.1 Ig-like domain-containing protein [Microvirga sp. ACRRW]
MINPITHKFGATYYLNNSGTNTIDGFTITSDSSITGSSDNSNPNGNSIYIDGYHSGTYEGQPEVFGTITWTADGIDVLTFDLDSFVVGPLYGSYAIQITSSSSSGIISTAWFHTATASAQKETIDVDEELFNDITSFTVKIFSRDGLMRTDGLDMFEMTIGDIKAAPPPNPIPVVDANGAVAGAANLAHFTEGSNGPSAAVSITSSTATITDDDTITGMTLVLSATPDGSDEAILYSPALNMGHQLSSFGLTGSYNETTRTYTISGTASAAVYQDVLRAMLYSNGSDAPSTVTRTITISVTDAEGATGRTTSAITITPGNDKPSATNLTQSKSVTEGGGAINLDGIVVTDPDGQGEIITATLTLSNPAAGTLSVGTYGAATSVYDATTGVWSVTGSVVNVNQALAAVQLTPSANNDQNFTITTRIRDAANAGPADGSISVTVTPVNDTPVVTVASNNIALTEDAPIALTGMSFSDVDAGSGAVLVTLMVPVGALSAVGGAGVAVYGTPAELLLRGTIADINAFIAAGKVIYTSAANDTGTRVLTVSINDGGNTGTGGQRVDTKWVNLNIASVNDAPVVTVPSDAVPMQENTATALTGISFSDTDAGSGNVTVTFSVPAGTLTAASGAGVVIGGTSLALTLTGTIANINAFIAASNITYTPALNDLGTRVLTASINDGGNAGAGGSLTDTKTFSLTIVAANAAPVVTVPSAGIQVTEDMTTTLAGISFSDTDAGSGNVTVTLSVPAGMIAASAAAGVTVGGTSIARTLTGTIADINAFIAAGNVTYTPVANENGVRVLTVTINDLGNNGMGGPKTDTKTVNLTVSGVNDAPTIISGADYGLPGMNEDAASIGVTVSSILAGAGYGDVDAGALSGVAVTGASGNGTWEYSTDGLSWTSFGAVSNSSALLLTSATQVRYVADGNNGETPVFTFRAWDRTSGAASSNNVLSKADTTTNGGTTAFSSQTATVSIAVASINDAPVATVVGSIPVVEDTATALTGISFTDVDAGSASVTVTLSVQAGTLMAMSSGGVVVGGTNTALTLIGTIANINAFIAASHVIYTPAADDTGAQVLTVSINDGGNTGGGHALSHTTTVNLNVAAVNDVATFTGTDWGAVAENGTQMATGVLVVADLDTGEAGFRAQSDVRGTYGTFSFDAVHGIWTYVLDSGAAATKALRSGEVKTETFTVKAIDGTVKTVSVQVSGYGELIDGVEVTTETIIYPDGSSGRILTIPVVTSDRANTDGGASVADIPLVTSGGRNVLTAQVPVGFGLQVSGPSAPRSTGDSLADLIREIQSRTATDSVDQDQITGGGSDFLGGLAPDVPMLVQTITPSILSGTSPTQPLGITGDSSSGVVTALIIDTSSSGGAAHLLLNNVDFAAIVGSATITGGAGSQTVFADSASQHIVLGADDDTIHGGGGNDYVGSLGGNDHLYGDDGNDTVSGGIGNDRLWGGNGHDRLLGGSGNDRLDGGNGHDTLEGGAGADRLTGGAGSDRVYGGAGNDYLDGGSGTDFLWGGAGNDRLYGGAGNDVLRGEAGNDWIVGGLGRDKLWGGAGSDTFAFHSIQESRVGSQRDVIYDFQSGIDRIDLRKIDADMTQKGNQSFIWVGAEVPFLAPHEATGFLSAGFTGRAGELQYTNGILMGDVDGDGKANFEIRIVGFFASSDVLL